MNGDAPISDRSGDGVRVDRARREGGGVTNKPRNSGPAKVEVSLAP
jgi:hypothetical protein